jgi:DNA-binding MarR family transcriptional regulator
MIFIKVNQQGQAMHCQNYNFDAKHAEDNPKRIIFGLVKKVLLDTQKRFMKKNIGITHFQYIVMHIVQSAPMTLKSLADRLDVKSPSLVPAVNSLEKSRLIHKKQDPKDKRKIILSLSELGLKKIKGSVFEDDNDLLTLAFNKMSAVKRKQLVSLLQELSGKL